VSVELTGFHLLVDRLSTEPVEWGRESRVGMLGELQRFRGWLDTREAAVLNVAHLECDDINSGARDIIQLCQQRANVSFGEGKRRAALATWLPQLPAAHQALGSGFLGSAQADELCRLAERLEPVQLDALVAAEADLVAELSAMTPVQARNRLALFQAELCTEQSKKKRLERQRRENSLKLTKRSDDTIGIAGALDPISGEFLRNCVDNKVSEMWRRQRSGREALEAPSKVMTNEYRRAEALIELVRAGATGQHVGTGGVEMLVLIDYQTLLEQLSDAGVCQLGDGTQIPADVARQLACDANIIPVVLAGPSVVLDVGRAARVATGGQRAALRAMHDSCCVKGCDVAFNYCQIHHIVWWRNRGRSDLDNLAPVCSKHHHLIHNYGWDLTLDHNRVGSLSRDAAPSSTISDAMVRHPGSRRAPTVEQSRQKSGKRDVAAQAQKPETMFVPMRC